MKNFFIRLASVAFVPIAVQAGGLMMTEVGSADIGLASAGYGARAQDPTTLLTNPAGLTQLKGTQVQMGGQLLYGDMSFSSSSGTTPALGSNEGGNPVGLFPAASFFMSHQLSDEVTIGFGVASNFGLAEDYDDNWQGRYYIQDATLIGISALPSIAYKVNDQLSIGATLNIMTGIMENKLAINNVNPALGDGQLKLEDTDVGVGLNVGLLYHLSAATRMGVTYTSEVKLDFDMDTEFSGLGAAEAALFANMRTIDMGMTIPQTIDVSIYHWLDEKWAILGSLGWQDWSNFGYVDVDVNNAVSSTVEAKLKDTYHAAVGAQYKLDEPTLLSFGLSYDSGFQDSNNASPTLPSNVGWKIGASFQKQSSKTFEWGVAAEYQYGEEFNVQKNEHPLAQGDLYGSYQPQIFIIGANCIWKF